MSRHAPYPPAPVDVTVRGYLPGAEDYAIQRVNEVQRTAPEPVLNARVKLTKHRDPAVEKPYIAQANLDMRGKLIRAEATGISVTEAVDLLHDRLRRRLEKSARHWEAIRGQVPTDGGWRHGQLPSQLTPYFPRPVDEREVVRHKAYSLALLTVDEAAEIMDEMDYGFHLFTEPESGLDSVLYRDEHGYRLAQVSSAPERAPDTSLPLTMSAHPAAELTLDQAIERLNISGQLFLFFRNTHTDRGNVLYLRYDGHYGLITPADGAD